MDSLLNPFLSYLLLYKYVALFAIVYSSAVILPLPSNAMLLAVGAFSSQGYFNFWISLTVAVVANTLGDLTDYALTRIYGDWIIRALRIDRIKFFVQLKEELRIDAAITVFITRFSGVVSAPASFLAGLVGVPFGTFLLFDFFGNVIEPFVALLLGYIVGNYWNDFSNLFGLVGAAIGVGVVLFILVRIYRRMMRRLEGKSKK